MTVWRVARFKFAPTPRAAYSGVGAARRGGRWNSRGLAGAYAASSRALAVLEYLAHIDRDLAPTDLNLFGADLPDDIEALKTKLPHGWARIPAPPALRSAGDTWLRSKRSLALLVPSVLVHDEKNVLVNPSHPRFREIRFHKPVPFALDSRLLGNALP